MRDEIPGRFAVHGLSVAANQVTDAGTLTWQTPASGRRLWQVGKLDRSAAEFAHGGAIHRSGIRGWCQEETVTFETSRLRVGKNVLEVRLKPHRGPGQRFDGAPYIAILLDALRLELE